MQKAYKKGFTLIELLVVIGILAILTAAVVIVLNPVELLKQSRDAQRFSDMDAVRSAINLYLSTSPSPTFLATASRSQNTDAGVLAGEGCLAISNLGTYPCTLVTSTAVDGTGWVPIDFTTLATTTVGLSAPLSALPTDPINNSSYHYAGAFDATNKWYDLNSVLESAKFTARMASDGGVSSTVYEVGNHLGM